MHKLNKFVEQSVVHESELMKFMMFDFLHFIKPVKYNYLPFVKYNN